MKPRTLTIALIASLTINVFLLSAVGAGAVMRYRATTLRPSQFQRAQWPHRG